MNNKFQIGDKVTSLGWCRGIVGVVEDFVKGHGESYTYKVHVSTWNKCPYDTVFALPESDLQIIPPAFKFKMGDIVTWRGHPNFEPGKIIHRCTGAIDGVNIYTLRNWEGKVTRFSEFNLELATKAKDFPDYKFKIGDIVKYAHFITGEKRLYEVVGRHRGVIHNRYTLIGAHDHSKNPGTFVKQENLLKLYSPKYTWVVNYKTSDAVDCTHCAYTQVFDIETSSEKFYRTYGADASWLIEAELYNDMDKLESKIIHFGE